MPRKESPIASRKNLFSKTGGDDPQPEEPAVPRSKRTYYLPEDVVILLGELQFTEHRRTGSKPELSDLVAEAIRQFATQRLDSQAS